MQAKAGAVFPPTTPEKQETAVPSRFFSPEKNLGGQQFNVSCFATSDFQGLAPDGQKDASKQAQPYTPPSRYSRLGPPSTCVSLYTLADVELHLQCSHLLSAFCNPVMWSLAMQLSCRLSSFLRLKGLSVRAPSNAAPLVSSSSGRSMVARAVAPNGQPRKIPAALLAAGEHGLKAFTADEDQPNSATSDHWTINSSSLPACHSMPFMPLAEGLHSGSRSIDAQQDHQSWLTWIGT